MLPKKTRAVDRFRRPGYDDRAMTSLALAAGALVCAGVGLWLGTRLVRAFAEKARHRRERDERRRMIDAHAAELGQPLELSGFVFDRRRLAEALAADEVSLLCKLAPQGSSGPPIAIDSWRLLDGNEHRLLHAPAPSGRVQAMLDGLSAFTCVHCHKSYPGSALGILRDPASPPKKRGTHVYLLTAVCPQGHEVASHRISIELKDG